MATLGENIRALRKSRGYSQEKFAELIGSNQVTLSCWELDQRRPSLETIQNIASTFHVPVSSLLSIESSGNVEDSDRELLDVLHSNPKIRLLFDKTRYMNSSDLDAVLGVVNAIAKERNDNP